MKSCLLIVAALVFACMLTFDTRVGVPVSDGTAGAVYGAFCSGSCSWGVEYVCGSEEACTALREVPGGIGNAYKTKTKACPVSGCGTSYTTIVSCSC